MPKKPRTKPHTTDKRYQSDPRKFKKVFLKHVFQGNQEAYDDFLRLWDRAKLEGRVFVTNVAWVYFYQEWEVDEDGTFVRREKVNEI